MEPVVRVVLFSTEFLIPIAYFREQSSDQLMTVRFTQNIRGVVMKEYNGMYTFVFVSVYKVT